MSNFSISAFMENLNKRTAQRIRQLKSTLPAFVLERHFLLAPSLRNKYTERQKGLYVEDIGYHISYLAESIAIESHVLFAEYVGWIKTFFSNLPVPESDLILSFEILRDALDENLDEEMKRISSDYLNRGIEHFKQMHPAINSYITDENPYKEIAGKYLNLLIYGDRRAAAKLIMEAHQEKISVRELYLNVFTVTQKETGRLWQMNKITVAQEHYITAATQLIMSQLYPYLFNAVHRGRSIIVSCAPGELHEIGARMVADLFEMEGWDSYYYGANTPRESLIKAISEKKPDVLALSATMIFNLSSIEQLIAEVRNEPSFDGIKILVGGYPFSVSGDLWNKIGADGYAGNPVDAIALAESLIEKAEAI